MEFHTSCEDRYYTSKEELLDVLGEGNVTVLLYAEWGE